MERSYSPEPLALVLHTTTVRVKEVLCDDFFVLNTTA